MKQLLACIFLLPLVSCNEIEPYTPSIAITTATALVSPKESITTYRKMGNILDVENFQEKHNIIMWNSYMGPRDTLYRFQPGEGVIVYGKTGEYVYLSPAKDTTLVGYILEGWIEFDHLSKANNAEAIAAIPEVVRNSASASIRTGMQSPSPNIGKLLRGHVRQKADSIYFDEKHLLQDELEPGKRTDTIDLYFEKQ